LLLGFRLSIGQQGLGSACFSGSLGCIPDIGGRLDEELFEGDDFFLVPSLADRSPIEVGNLKAHSVGKLESFRVAQDAPPLVDEFVITVDRIADSVPDVLVVADVFEAEIAGFIEERRFATGIGRLRRRRYLALYCPCFSRSCANAFRWSFTAALDSSSSSRNATAFSGWCFGSSASTWSFGMFRR